MTRRRLQIATAVLAAVPVLTGLLGLAGIDDPIYAKANLPSDAMLDSNLRFYSGVWLGLGMAAFWIVPRIERETALFRALWLMIFLGGMGRLLSMVWVGRAFPPFLGFTVLEVVGAPAFVWWQHRVAQAHRSNCRNSEARRLPSASSNLSNNSDLGSGKV